MNLPCLLRCSDVRDPAGGNVRVEGRGAVEGGYLVDEHIIDKKLTNG